MSGVQLQLQNIGSTLTAGDYFGSMPGLLVGIPSSSIFKPWLTIPAGYYALVTSNGAMIPDPKTGSVVWSGGFHWTPPWVSVSHLVYKGVTVFDTPIKGCKTKDNVTVSIDINCVFRVMGDESMGEDPKLVPRFVHQVTPRGLQQQLADAMDEAVRVLARAMKHKEVYGLRSVNVDETERANPMSKSMPVSNTTTVGYKGEPMEIGEEGEEEKNELLEGAADDAETRNMTKATQKGTGAIARVIEMMNKQFKPQGVEIIDAMITNVELPNEIVTQLSNKTMAISNNAQEVMTQQYQMQDLKFTEELKKAKQVSVLYYTMI